MELIMNTSHILMEYANPKIKIPQDEFNQIIKLIYKKRFS